MISNAARSPLVVSPATTPTPPDPEPQRGIAAHPFAEMLRQNRLAEAPRDAAPAPAPDRAPAEANSRQADAGEQADAAETAPQPSQRDATRAKARSAAAPHALARPPAAAARPIDTPEDAKKTDDTAHAGKPAPADAAALAGATSIAAAPEQPPRLDRGSGERPGTPAPGGNAAPPGLDAANDAGIAAALDTGSPRTIAALAGKARRAGPGPAADAATGRSARIAHDAEGEAKSLPFQDLLAESKSAAHAGTAPPGADRALGSAAAPAQASAPLRELAPGADAGVASATVPVPVDSPEFAAAFGVQVSVFARDGIQHAELHLNPAEMGPVSIQITLDGTQARVDFGADAAATRQAIESGLPELASALRDAGFTLAGGGVAQHSRPGGGQGDGADPDRSGSRRDAADRGAGRDSAGPRVTTRRVAAGGVDLYA